MTPPRIVVDSGALERVASDPWTRVLVERLVDQGWTGTVPAVVLSEALTDRPRDAPVNQVVRRFGTTITTEPIARVAGALRATTSRTSKRVGPSGIDAIVAAHAIDASAAVVLTTNPTDLSALVANQTAVSVKGV